MEHTIKLTDEHLGVVGVALAELPFKVAQPVMAAIQAQIEAAAQEVTSPAGDDGKDRAGIPSTSQPSAIDEQD